MFNRVLVVCVGNICRSPVAQELLRQRMPDKEFISAGLAAVVGQDIDPSARAVALANGLVCPRHKARQLTPDMCAQADLILVMENHHREMVTNMSPQSRAKTFLLGVLLDGMEIADPYQRSMEVFEHVFEQMRRAADSWAERLK